MKLLLDQGLPRSTAGLLRNAGIEAVHVGELDMAAASDEAIIEYAHSHFFAIVTLDSDFHALLAVRNANKPSVIRLRVQRLRSPGASSLISTVLQRVGHEIQLGSFVTVTSRNIRVRSLPIGAKHESEEAQLDDRT